MIDLGLGRFSTGMRRDDARRADSRLMALGGVLVDALRIITDHVWRSAAAWRRICRSRSGYGFPERGGRICAARGTRDSTRGGRRDRPLAARCAGMVRRAAGVGRG